MGAEPDDARAFVRDIVGSSVEAMVSRGTALLERSEPENVHAFRVASRRLRSDLRTFRPLLDRAWVESLRDELAWISGSAGTVRDGDVLTERLRAAIAALTPSDAQAAEPLLAAACSSRGSAVGLLQQELRSERYAALVDALTAASAQPKFAGDGDLDQSARAVVRALVRRAWRRLRRRVRAAGRSPSDEELHEIRIAAKRCRYASEAAATVFGRKPEKFAARLADLQRVLGDHHDTTVAEEWLRCADGGFSAGLIVARERDERRRLERRWREAWRRASRRKLRRWL